MKTQEIAIRGITQQRGGTRHRGGGPEKEMSGRAVIKIEGLITIPAKTETEDRAGSGT